MVNSKKILTLLCGISLLTLPALSSAQQTITVSHNHVILIDSATANDDDGFSNDSAAQSDDDDAAIDSADADSDADATE